MPYKPDPVTMQVIRYAMEQVTDEMGRTLVRTSRSTVIKEIEDISCAVFDRHGNTVAQAHHAPMLLTGFELGMRSLLQRFRPEDFEEGDIIIFNDPYSGGQHVMDLVSFAPVFFDGELVGFVGSIAHHSDMVGAAPGGTAGGLTEIYLEGLRFPFVKLYKRVKKIPNRSASWPTTSASLTKPSATFALKPRPISWASDACAISSPSTVRMSSIVV